MRVTKTIQEAAPYLIKAKLMIEGSNQFRILAIEKKSGVKVTDKKPIRFRGSEEAFAKFLMKLKAKDVESEPATVRNKKYKDMITTAKDGSDPYIWIWSNVWVNSNKMIIKEEDMEYFTNKKIQELEQELTVVLERINYFDSVDVIDSKMYTGMIDDTPLDEHQLVIMYELSINDEYFQLDNRTFKIQFTIYRDFNKTYTDIELLDPEVYSKEFNMIDLYNLQKLKSRLEIILEKGALK